MNGSFLAHRGAYLSTGTDGDVRLSVGLGMFNARDEAGIQIGRGAACAQPGD